MEPFCLFNDNIIQRGFWHPMHHYLLICVRTRNLLKHEHLVINTSAQDIYCFHLFDSTASIYLSQYRSLIRCVDVWIWKLNQWNQMYPVLKCVFFFNEGLYLMVTFKICDQSVFSPYFCVFAELRLILYFKMYFTGWQTLWCFICILLFFF